MGNIKHTAYDKNYIDFALLLKSIAHPARLLIIEHLLKEKECVCSKFVGELDLAQSTVSQHLKELKKVGLIKGDVEGRNVCYCLDKEKYQLFQEKTFEFFKRPSEAKTCC